MHVCISFLVDFSSFFLKKLKMNISEELIAEINNLLQDVCTFLQNNNLHFSSTDRKSANNLIDRLKNQLGTISGFRTNNNGYIDMNCEKIKQLYESVDDKDEHEILSNECSLPDLPAKYTPKNLKNGIIIMRRKKFNFIDYSTKIYAAIHNNWLLLYWSDKDTKPFRALDLKIYQAQEDEAQLIEEETVDNKDNEHNSNNNNINNNNKKQQKRALYFKVFDNDDKKCYNFMANSHEDMTDWVANINKQHELIKSTLKNNQEDVYVEVYQNYHYLPPKPIDTRPPLPDRPSGFLTTSSVESVPNTNEGKGGNLQNQEVQSSTTDDDDSSTYYELDTVPVTSKECNSLKNHQKSEIKSFSGENITEEVCEVNAIGACESVKKQKIFIPNSWKNFRKTNVLKQEIVEDEKNYSKLLSSKKLPASIKHISSSSVKVTELKKRSNINNVLANMIKKRANGTNDLEPMLGKKVGISTKVEDVENRKKDYTENIYEELTVTAIHPFTSSTSRSNNDNVMKIFHEKRNVIERNSLLTFQSDHIKDISLVEAVKQDEIGKIAIESHSNTNRNDDEVPKVLLTNNVDDKKKMKKISPSKLKFSRKK